MIPILDWTGHALVDVGIAGLCALATKDDPKLLTVEDLEFAAKEMQRYYFSGAMTSYLSCVFMNSEYVQPGSGPKKEQSRREYAERVLFAYRRTEPEPEARGRHCAFSGGEATHLIHRGQMPMLTGEEVLNFFPALSGGLAVAGAYLTAIQAVPLAGRRAEGKLLVVHSDHPSLTLAFARRYLEDNLRVLNLGLAGQWPTHDGPDPSLTREHGAWDATKKRAKMPDAKMPTTLVMSDLTEVLRSQELADKRLGASSMSVYWLSSSGQGPSLQLFDVPSQIVRFLARVQSESTRRAWGALVHSGWPTEDRKVGGAKSRSKKPVEKPITGPGISRNPVLQDLFAIYASGTADLPPARRFASRRLLPAAVKTEDGGGHWSLVELFLEEVLGMSPERIQAVKDFSDRLAQYVAERNNKRFLQRLLTADRLYKFRAVLVKTQRRDYVENDELLFTLEEFLSVLEADEAVGISDWSLIRDLISIRIVQKLKELGYRPGIALTEEDEEEVEDLEKVQPLKD